MGNKTHPPHIIIIYIGQYILRKLFLIPRKGFKEITGSRVNMLEARCFLKEFIHKAYNPARDEERTEISNQYDSPNYDNETQSIILYPNIAKFIYMRKDCRLYTTRCV